MITDAEIEISAPASRVWDVYSDVERWPEWTPTVERLVAQDGADLQPGRRYRIKQPRFPNLVWQVTTVETGQSWTWRQRSPGGTTIAVHEVVPLAPDRTLVRQRLEQRGPLGRIVGLLTRRLTRRYLDLEGRGLKARAEELHEADPAAPDDVDPAPPV